MSRLAAAAGLWLTFFLMPFYQAALGYSDADCIDCHASGGHESRLQIVLDDFDASVHGAELSCTDCHQDVWDETHTEMTGAGAVDCRQCHDQEQQHAADEQIACHTCHTQHAIFRAADPRASVHWRQLPQTCAQCHPDEARSGRSFFDVFSRRIVSHPKQDFSRNYSRRMCVGCHQGQAAHGETEPVNDQNCYRCHMPLAENKALFGYIHPTSDPYWRLMNRIAVICLTIIGGVFAFAATRLWTGGRRNKSRATHSGENHC